MADISDTGFGYITKRYVSLLHFCINFAAKFIG